LKGRTHRFSVGWRIAVGLFQRFSAFDSLAHHG
jgi:hypothetical protein